MKSIVFNLFLLMCASLQLMSQGCDQCRVEFSAESWKEIPTYPGGRYYTFDGDDSIYSVINTKDSSVTFQEIYRYDTLVYYCSFSMNLSFPNAFYTVEGDARYGWRLSPLGALSESIRVEDDTLTILYFHENGMLETRIKTLNFVNPTSYNEGAKHYEYLEYIRYDDEGNLVRFDTVFTAEEHEIYYYYPDGSMMGRYTVYGDEIPLGPFEEYYYDGSIKRKGSLHYFPWLGKWTNYDRNGEVISEENVEAYPGQIERAFEDGDLRE